MLDSNGPAQKKKKGRNTKEVMSAKTAAHLVITASNVYWTRSRSATLEKVPRVILSPHFKPLKPILRKSYSVCNFNTTEISRWSTQDVCDYFIGQNFNMNDAFSLKEQEIDGEALLFLQRDDLRNLNLRIGIFIKMWNHIQILQLQAGKI